MKIKLLFVYLFLGTFLFQVHAQTLNQNAGWPNTNWSVTGTFNTDPLAFEADPTSTANFAFDDDDAGSGSDDIIAAESPVIDLSAAFTAGETWISITGNFVYNYNNDDILQFEYWDADASTWNIIGTPFNADTASPPLNDFCAGTSEVYTTDILNIAAFTPTQLSGFRYRIYFDDLVGGAGFEWGFCFDSPTIVSATPPSCIDPTMLSASNITDTMADLAWTENGTATVWNVEIVDVTAMGSVTGTATNSGVANPFNITGLTPQNDYEFYVQADCGTNGTSSWIGPFAFTTACAPAVAPYTETFDNGGAIPACWNQGATNSEDWLFADGSLSEPGHGGDTGAIVDHTSGTGYFAWVNDSTPDNLGTTLESPLVDVSGLTNPALSFWINSNNEGFSNVSFSVDFYDGAAWNTAVYTSNSNTAGWAQAVVDLSSYTITGPVQARFIVDEDNVSGHFYDDIALDDVSFDEAPSCFAPINVQVTATTVDGATIDFTNGNTSTNTNFEYGAPGFTQGTGTTLAQTSIPFTVTGLMSATTYDFYLQSDCGMGDVTAWVGPFSFTTDCIAVADFNENFDGVSTPNLPNCWSSIVIENATGTDPAVTTSTAADNTAPNGARLYNGSGDLTTPNDAFLISPELTTLSAGTHRLRFFADGSPAGDVEVGTITNPSDPATFTLFETVAITTTHTEYIVDFSTYTGTDSYIAFRHPNTTTFDSIYLDDIVWEAIPNCVKPNTLTAANETTTTADLSWISGGSGESLYDVEIGITGFTPTGTPTDTGVANPFTASMLTASTTYDYYVRAACGPGDVSVYEGPFTFSTLCDAVSDFNENFDAVSTPDLPNCWSSIVIENATGTDPAVTTSTAADNSAPNGARLYNGSGNPTTPNDVLLISPQLNTLSAGTHRLRFFADGSPAGDVEVGTITNPSDPATFTLFETVAITTTHTEYTVDFSTYSGTDVYIAFRHPNLTTFDSIYLDDVIFEAIPACLAPSDLSIIVATDTDITIGWTNNAGAAASSVIYGAPGFDPTAAGVTIVGTGDMVSISNLTPETAYDIYVAQDCSATGDGLSVLVGPLNVTTACTALVAPYTEDFENAGATPNCWTLGGDEDWLFNTSGPNQVGNGGTLTGATASGGYYAVVDDSTPDASNAQLDSPFVDVSGLTTPELSFYLISDNSSDTRTTPINATLTVSVWDGAAWNVVGTYNTDTVGWELRSIDISTLTFTGPAQARFSVADSGSFYDDIAIDDVTFAEAPVCSDVTAVTIDSVTSDSVTVSWIENSVPVATAWEVVAVPTGDPVPSVGTSNATTNPYSISMLSSSTVYDIYVRSDCATTFVGPITATTDAGCGDLVYDTGGATGSYSNNESYTITYLPDAAGNVVTLDFTTVDLENCCDTLEVFDGLDVTAVAFTNDLESPASFRATNPDGAITIRFTSDGSVTGSGWEASYTCALAPTCLEPTSLTATSITTTTADLLWTPGGSGETAWDVEVLLAGAIPTGIPTDAGVGNPFMATGLSSGTEYQYWVRAACGPGDVSIWSGPFIFTTLAACGDTVYDTGGATRNYSDGESYTVTYLPDSMSNIVTLDFTLVDLENCCDTLEIFDGIDVTAPVLESDLESPASFTALNADGAITIRFTSDGSINGAGWEATYTCTPRPSCVNVSSLTIDSVTSDSITVSWIENNIPAGTAWEVIAVPTGDPAPTVGTSNATVNPFTISSLMPNTVYDVYVRTDCSMSFTGPVMATTDCAVNSVYPYVTDFINNVPNACWDEAGSGEITDGPMTIGASQWRANRSYEDFAGNVTPSNAMNLYRNSDREWLLSEQYDMTGTSNDVLSIEVAVTAWTTSGASDATDTATMGSDDQVDLLITTDGGMTWTSLMTWNAANQPAVDGTREDIDLSSYTGTVQFAFFATDGTVDDLEDYDFHVGMFIIDGTAGSEDVFENSLSLYPNPVNGDTVTISRSNSNNAAIQIAIFNTLGQQVMTRSYPQATNEIQIDNLSRLSKGMYLIKVTDGKQESTLKFIKE